MGLLQILDGLGDKRPSFLGGQHDNRVRAEEHIQRGVELALRGQLEEALTEFRKAVARCPKMAEAHFNIGLTCANLGRPTEAVHALRKAVVTDPEYLEAHHHLGVVYASMGKHVEAISAYLAALRLRRDCVEALHGLGEVYNKFGDDKQAFKAWHRALSVRPDYAPTYDSLIRLHVDRKEHSIALQVCEQLMRIDATEAGKLHRFILASGKT